MQFVFRKLMRRRALMMFNGEKRLKKVYAKRKLNRLICFSLIVSLLAAI